MKVKLAVVVSASEAMGRLASQAMPASTSFRIAKNLKVVQSELESYDETRKKLIEKHGKDGEISPDSKNWEKFIDEMNELLGTEIDLKIDKIKQSTLSKVEVSPADLLSVDFLIKE